MSTPEVRALLSIPADAIVITNEIQEADQSANLIVLRKARKELEKKFDELKRPFKEGLDKLKLEFALVVDPIELREKVIGAAILTWKKAEQVRIEKEMAESVAVHQAALREAARTNTPPPAPKPIEEQAKGWKSDRGTLSTRRIPKWRVVDETLIPYTIQHNGETLKLWEIVSASVTKIRQAAGDQPSPIPGIEFYYEEGLGVR